MKAGRKCQGIVANPIVAEFVAGCHDVVTDQAI